VKRAKFLKIPPCTLSDVKSEKEVIAKSRILEVGGEKAAEISLYYKNQLKARYFADEENHYAWINDKWTTCRLDNVARMCKNLPVEKEAYYWSNKEFIWNTKEDKQRVTDFLDSCDVDDYETNLSEIKRARANKRKSERIEKEMSDVPCVTEDMERWLDEKVFPGHILFSKREGKGTAYICTACKRSGSVKEKWKHKEIVHCPKCNQVASVNNRQKQKVEHTPVVILQKCNDRWVERQFKAICRWSKGGKEIKLFEQCRALIPMGKTYGKVYYGTINNADEFEQDFWDKNPAGKCKELMKEGRELHHCVGASDIYMKKMAAGETWILFLRKKEDLEKAYYTVEINLKTDKIIQFYSEFDRQPDKKVIEKLLNKYTKRLKTMKQPIMAAAV